MSTPILLRASGRQIAIAWLGMLPELAGIPVAATLPPPQQWGGQDFITVAADLGGIPDEFIKTRVPVLQIDAWAVAPNSTRPAWNRCSATAEAIRDACYGSLQSGPIIVNGFIGALLHDVRVLAEPRRMEGDIAAIARYMLTLQFIYTSAPPA
jgi:hypothetical protein